MKREELTGKTIISWGGYEYFVNNVQKLPDWLKIDCICGEKDYIKAEGYKIISREELLQTENSFVIISLAKVSDITAAANWLRSRKITYTHLSLLTEKPEKIYSDLVRALGGTCTDLRGNTYSISSRLKGNAVIHAETAHNAKLTIGACELRDSLNICMMGESPEIRIGDGTLMLNDCLVMVNSFGKVIIRDDCMFSHHIELSQPDQHLIFDMHTGERINQPKSIEIGNHVWIGRDVKLLGGARIGDNSIVGGYTVTSGKFPSNVAIAGSPAKIVREGVIWSRDNETDSWDKVNIRECRDQRALKYLKQ